MTSRKHARAYRSSLRASDVARLGLTGLRARPMRAVLSALGIAIGIAAQVRAAARRQHVRAERPQLFLQAGLRGS